MLGEFSVGFGWTQLNYQNKNPVLLAETNTLKKLIWKDRFGHKTPMIEAVFSIFPKAETKGIQKWF